MQRHAIGQIAFIIKFRAAYGKADQPRMLLKGNSQRFRWEKHKQVYPSGRRYAVPVLFKQLNSFSIFYGL